MGREWLGQESEPESAPVEPASAYDPLLGGGYGLAGLRNECAYVAAAQQGTRNDALNRAAFSVGQLVAGGSLLENVAVDALIEACQVCGLWQEDPVGCRNTIVSGMTAGYEKPRYPAERPDGPVSPQEDQPTPETRRIDWDAAWAGSGPLEWLCEPIIPAGRLVALYSPPKVGKSLLTLEIAVAISRGTPILGTRCKQTPVLYLDYENAMDDVVDRLKSMHLEPANVAGLHYESFPTLPPLDSPIGGLALLGMAQECGAGLVVIDTISRAIQGDENEASTWLALYRHTLLKLKAEGIAVLRLDHTGKDQSKGMRGSSAKLSDVDLVWRLEEIAKGDSYLLNCEDHRIRMGETLLNIERRSDPLGHHIDMRSISEAREAAALRALDDAGLPIEAGRDRARAVLNQAGIRMSNAALSKLLRERQGSADQGQAD